MRVLWIKSGPLYPLNTGGRKRTHAMLVELSRSHEITYLSFHDSNAPITYEEERSGYAARKRWVPLRELPKPSLPLFFALAKNLVFSTYPWALAKWLDPAMVAAIEEECRLAKFDLLVCDFLYPALNVVNANHSLPTLLFQHNMESQIWSRMAKNRKSPLARAYFASQHGRFFRAERDLSAKFDGIVTVSPEDSAFARERYRLENVLGDVPTGVDVAFFASQAVPRRPKRLGFLGSMDWMPNIEGLLWFAEAILPLLRRTDPGIELAVIGRNPPASIRNLATPGSGISVTGTVEDVRPFVSECRAIVVPLRSGGGTRLKILEALAMGVPVVSTSIGAEGLSLADGRHLLLADSPAEFADSCLKLVQDDELHALLSRDGRELVEREHGWPRAAATFESHCRRLLASLSPGNPQP